MGPEHTAALRKRSPLMLHVVLEQIRRARGMDVASDLRMERDMVRHCFYLRPVRARPWRACVHWRWTRTTTRNGIRHALKR
jgi:hypothetical protein